MSDKKAVCGIYFAEGRPIKNLVDAHDIVVIDQPPYDTQEEASARNEPNPEFVSQVEVRPLISIMAAQLRAEISQQQSIR
jgi:hypothetical protein